MKIYTSAQLNYLRTLTTLAREAVEAEWDYVTTSAYTTGLECAYRIFPDRREAIAELVKFVLRFPRGKMYLPFDLTIYNFLEEAENYFCKHSIHPDGDKKHEHEKKEITGDSGAIGASSEDRGSGSDTSDPASGEGAEVERGLQ